MWLSSKYRRQQGYFPTDECSFLDIICLSLILNFTGHSSTVGSSLSCDYYRQVVHVWSISCRVSDTVVENCMLVVVQQWCCACCYFILVAKVILVSSVEQDGRTAACPGELVTFTCTVTQGVSLNWASTAFTSCDSTPTYTLEVSTSVGSISICGSFQANLTAVTNRTQIQGSLQADLTSTLSPNTAVSMGGADI